MNKYILIFLGVAIVGVVAWLLLRKKSSSVAQNNTWDNPRPYTPAPVVQPSIPPTQVPIAVPPHRPAWTFYRSAGQGRVDSRRDGWLRGVYRRRRGSALWCRCAIGS